MRKVAIFMDDISFPKVPLYILNEETGMYEMEGDSTFQYSKEEVLHSGEFIAITVAEKEETVSTYT